ncbi:MAG: phosphoribosylanthranilate isomerase [Gemmatimonadales bacterium]|nr:phosphoribosylanthranilate isomerase [Gemmatimonadales bacterium]
MRATSGFAPPRVKICCIASRAEAQMAMEHGAQALGLVSAMPSGPGVIDERTIAEIASEVPPPIGTFLLTSETEAGVLAAQQRRCRTNTLQLCDRVSIEALAELRIMLPGIRIVQVVHITGPAAVEEALKASSHVDALLLDSGRPDAAVRELGGTGRVHDWELSREIRDRAPVPIFLAGGLEPQNVGEAIRAVRPFGIDVCSGVRTGGRLDQEKLTAFCGAVARAGP